MDIRLLYYIWLGEKLQAGSVSPKILLEYYKSDINRIYNASEEDYARLNLAKKDIEKLCDKDLTDAKRYYEYCAKNRVGLLCYDSSFYPQRLKNINNPPPLFYYKGRIEMLDDYPCFAMVGTRSCSEKGYRDAYRMGYEAAYRGAVAVNGIASGIDAAVLKGALDADGYVVAFLGNGIDKVYPASNAELFRKVERRGLILSEFPPFSKSNGFNFPVRNRCISGISLATVIFEADEGSGALHTAAHAINQGRPVYAIPGDIDDPLYSGPLDLIKSGAFPATCADDFVLEYMELFPHRIEKAPFIKYPSDKENAAFVEAFGEKANSESVPSSRITLPKPKRFKDKKNKEADTKASAHSDPVQTTEDFSAKNHAEEKETTIDTSHLSADELMVISVMEKSEFIVPDDLVREGIKIDDALSSLTMLEIYGYVESMPGGRYRIKKQ